MGGADAPLRIEEALGRGHPALEPSARDGLVEAHAVEAVGLRLVRPPDTNIVLRACRDAGFEPDIVHQLDDYPTTLDLIAAEFGGGS